MSLARLLVEIANESDPQAAVDRLAAGALNLTGSRHALVAILNPQLGRLEIRAGAGAEFVDAHKLETLPIDVGQSDGIVAFVAATGSKLVSGNVAHEPRYRKLFESTLSEMAVPIKSRNGRVVGVLNVESDRCDAYSDTEVDALEGLAALASLIIEQRAHARREQALLEIGTSLDTALTEEELISRVMRVAGEVLRLEACSIFLANKDPDRPRFILRGTLGSLNDKIGEISYDLGEGFTGWVCERGEPIMLDDPQKDPRWRGKYVEFPSEHIASFLAVPIKSRKRCIGVIRVLRRKSDNPYLDLRFDANDRRLLQAIAEQIAVGLESLRNIDKLIRSERMIAWGELSAKSSHMIGNRVFALKGDVNELEHLVKETPPNLVEIAAIQKSLATNVMRVEEILQDFRDFVSATQIDRRPTDLNALVRETLNEVFPRRTNVELDVEFDSELPEVSVDQKKIRRVISELIENSFNYMEQGHLRVATKLQDRTEDEATRRSTLARYAKIEIEDSGPGIGVEQKGVIFQPFFSKRVKGMGLGLSIVKGIVDAHEGIVYEAGEEGKGAKFVILLPVADRPA